MSLYHVDVLLIKINGDGDTLWTRTYGSTATDRGKSVIETSDGGYLIALSNDFLKGSENIRGIEQTTSGYKKIRTLKLNFPVQIIFVSSGKSNNISLCAMQKL